MRPSARNDLSPLLQIERLPIDSLTAAPHRLRRGEAGQIAKIASSIRRFGLCAPILISKDRAIVHGRAVWEAARQRGVDEISCLVVDQACTPHSSDSRRGCKVQPLMLQASDTASYEVQNGSRRILRGG